MLKRSRAWFSAIVFSAAIPVLLAAGGNGRCRKDTPIENPSQCTQARAEALCQAWCSGRGEVVVCNITNHATCTVAAQCGGSQAPSGWELDYPITIETPY